MAVADWDFQLAAAFHSLSTADYVSPPKSLKFNMPSSPGADTILSRHPLCQCLPEGEVRTCMHSNLSSIYIANFRNQAALGTSNNLNCYFILYIPSKFQLWRYVGGGASLKGYSNYSFNASSWEKVRVAWWNGLTGGGAPCLSVAVYRYIGGEWVQVSAILQDTDNYFKDSATNRCGPMGMIIGGHWAYFDDTEIYGP